MILDEQILNTLRDYTKNLSKTVQLKLFHGDHEKRKELETMLEQVASVSDKIELVHAQTEFQVREGLTFEILSNDEKSGILFSGIPGGHEFNSFILALLQAGGLKPKFDEGLIKQIQAIQDNLQFETIISLDCHICPDIVQLLNQFAVLNPKISNEMIDGNTHPKYMEEMEIQGVPTVYLNKKPFSSGKITASEIIEKIQESYEIDPVETVVDDEVRDVVVIGGGPAAISSAIYTARKGLKVSIIAEKIGGQVTDTQGIENLISVPITNGKELAKNLGLHASKYPIDIKQEIRVNEIEEEMSSALKLVKLSSGSILKTKTIILATGAKWRELGVPGEKENIGSGVAYCPHCDGPFFKGKDVVVVGGGNSGIEAALDLSGITKSVTVLEFMESMKADKVLLDQVEKTANINTITHVATKKVVAENGKVRALNLENRETGEAYELPTDGVFVQIGLVPNSQFVKEFVELSPRGEITINERCETNTPGVFACGDVTTVPFKQIVIAMGEGAKAGLSAFEYLLKSSEVA